MNILIINVLAIENQRWLQSHTVKACNYKCVILISIIIIILTFTRIFVLICRYCVKTLCSNYLMDVNPVKFIQ